MSSLWSLGPLWLSNPSLITAHCSCSKEAWPMEGTLLCAQGKWRKEQRRDAAFRAKDTHVFACMSASRAATCFGLNPQHPRSPSAMFHWRGQQCMLCAPQPSACTLRTCWMTQPVSDWTLEAWQCSDESLASKTIIPLLLMQAACLHCSAWSSCWTPHMLRALEAERSSSWLQAASTSR